MLPDKKAALTLKANAKAFGTGPPRTVIATVLSTNTAPSAGNQGPLKKSGELTVCIPIQKEVKLHVKSRNSSLDEAEEEKFDKDTAVSEVAGNDVAKKEAGKKDDENITKETQPTDIKSPTLSLLKAQDLMFDPKFMYKEYNLRRVRKQEVSPEQSKPQKKRKVDKPLPDSKEKSKEPESKEHEADVLPRAERVKRERVGDNESSHELPEPKKSKEDIKEVEVNTTTGESGEQKESNNSEQKRTKELMNFSVSIPRHVSPSPPLTLTQLLSMPNNEQKKLPPSSPTKKIEEPNKQKTSVKGSNIAPKGTPAVGRGTDNRLSGRSQLLCGLCKLKGGVSNLGFLFGPYFYRLETDSNADSGSTSNSGSSVEIWLHEDCAVWAPGICLVGRELQGLKEALGDANKMVNDCT